MAEQTEWSDVEDAARYLNFHPNTVYRLVRDGTLPALRFPVRISREHLDACLDRCRIKPGKLRHLNQYAKRDHLADAPAITKAGTPDRRYGPRTKPSAKDWSPKASAMRGVLQTTAAVLAMAALGALLWLAAGLVFS